MAVGIHYRLRAIKNSVPTQYEWVVTLNGESKGGHYNREEVVGWIQLLRGSDETVSFGGVNMTAGIGQRKRLAEYLELVIE
jgi:hypothetical protein